MAHTVDAVIYDPATGEILMMVIPDHDGQLDDPAFNPKGGVQLRVPALAKGRGNPVAATVAFIDAASKMGVTLRVQATDQKAG